MNIVFYDHKEKEWLLFNKTTGKTEVALPEEIDNQIDNIISYLRDCDFRRQDIVVDDAISKTAKVAYELLTRFESPMTEKKLVSLIYLCDWRHCLTNNRQITNIQWIREMGAVPVISDKTPGLWSAVVGFEFLNEQPFVKLLETNLETGLERSELDSINHCYKVCCEMDISEFTKLVCSTYPLLLSNNFEKLNLIDMGRSYKLQGHWRPGISYE